MTGTMQRLGLRKVNINVGNKVKQKGVCIDCGLMASINKITHRCRMCQSKRKDRIGCRMKNVVSSNVWRYTENRIYKHWN